MYRASLALLLLFVGLCSRFQGQRFMLHLRNTAFYKMCQLKRTSTSQHGKASKLVWRLHRMHVNPILLSSACDTVCAWQQTEKQVLMCVVCCRTASDSLA